MQRTSIFAHSNKLIHTPQQHSNCPNCTNYQQEIQSLNKKISQMTRQVQIIKPFISGIGETSKLPNFQQQLIRIKKNYQSVLRRLTLLQKDNDQLEQENIRIIKQNKTLKDQIAKLSKQLRVKQQTQKEQHKQNNMKQTEKAESKKQKQMYLSDLDTNLTDKSVLLSNQIQATTNRNNELQDYLRRRIRIQKKRHQEINKLQSLLNFF